MRRCLSLLVVCAALLILPTGLLSQQPPGGGKGGKGGGKDPNGKGRGRGKGNTNLFGGAFDKAGINVMGGDPTQLFDMIANGKDTISRSDLQQDWQIQMFDRMTQGMKITNGELTKDQFRTGMEAATGQLMGLASGMMGLGGMGMDTDQIAENAFKRMDKDGNGVLDDDEMDPQLRQSLAQYDKNGDGVIDLTEYKAYMKDMMAQFSQSRGRNPGQRGANGPVDELDARPVVYRAGKLPNEMPSWFEQLDFVDRDGQIGLYEWVQSGRSVDEFKMWDRNDDGFITIDEVLSLVRSMNKSNDPNVLASIGNGPGGPGGGRGGRGGPGGGPGGGRADMMNIMNMFNPGGGRGGRDPNGGGPGAGGGRGGRGGNQDGGPGGGRGGRGGRRGGGGDGGDNEQ